MEPVKVPKKLFTLSKVLGLGYGVVLDEMRTQEAWLRGTTASMRELRLAGRVASRRWVG